MQSNQDGQDNGMITIPGLLNIFYRGRMAIAGMTLLGLVMGVAYGIIVKPLYRATAQVRPGVVSYNPDGYPLREWALDDVVTWFGSGMYWKSVKQNPLFEDAKSAPLIQASFVPSLDFRGGGNVVTLTNLAQSPELAWVTLNEAIDAFNKQALADSLGSSLYLTVRRGRLTMMQLNRDIEQVDAKEDRAALSIEEQKRELTLVELEKQGLELDLKAREAEVVWMREAVMAARTEVASARGRLGEAEKMLAVAVDQEKSADGTATGVVSNDPVSEVLKQSATREQAGRVGQLLLTVNGLSAFVSRSTVRADSLEAQIIANELEVQRIRLMQDLSLTKKRADIEQKISDLEIVLEKDLPHERTVLKSELEIERVKVEVISPLERVGTVSVTNNPVRPRKQRAAMILTILAFFGSLFVVLVWEYLRNNGEAIMASRK